MIPTHPFLSFLSAAKNLPRLRRHPGKNPQKSTSARPTKTRRTKPAADPGHFRGRSTPCCQPTPFNRASNVILERSEEPPAPATPSSDYHSTRLKCHSEPPTCHLYVANVPRIGLRLSLGGPGCSRVGVNTPPASRTLRTEQGSRTRIYKSQ